MVRLLKRKRGRPPKYRKLWRTVLRLSTPTARRLKSMARVHKVSLNTAIETFVEVGLDDMQND